MTERSARNRNGKAILVIRWGEYPIYTLVPAATPGTWKRRGEQPAGKKVHSSYILQSYQA